MSYFRGVLFRLLALSVTPSILFPAFFLWNSYVDGVKVLRERAHEIRRNLSDGCREGMITGEVEQYIAPLVNSALLQPEAAAVVFRDGSGGVIFSKSKKPAEESRFTSFQVPNPETEGEVNFRGMRYFYSTGQVFTWRMVAAEAMFGLEGPKTQVHLGDVTVFVSVEQLRSSLKRNTLISLLLVAIVIGSTCLAAISITRRVTSPVFQLIGAFKEFEEGNFHPALPKPKERELSELVEQFKTTTSRFGDLLIEKDSYSNQLLATAQELEDLNESLESKIAERTQSLRNAIEMLELTNRKIQESDRLKSEFLANMSHELRTPLNAVIGFSELMLEKIPGPLTDDQIQCLQDILTAGQHLLRLINEILDLSKVEAGKMTLNFTTLSLERVVSDVHNLFKPLLTKKRQALEIVCNDLSTPIYTDQNKLKQIVINLLSNAHKFSSEGSTIWLEIASGESCYMIEVRDEGIGIPEEHLEHIFEAFRQVDGTMSRAQEGTGLGLTLCKRFTELLGGVLKVRSKVGVGTMFTIYLPPDPSKPLRPEDYEGGKNYGESACS